VVIWYLARAVQGVLQVSCISNSLFLLFLAYIARRASMPSLTLSYPYCTYTPILPFCVRDEH
jgi:hypothetical protein